MNIDRRKLLASMGLLGVGSFSSLPAFASPIKNYPFTLGVASGDPWPDGFVIWTRLAPQPLQPGGGMSPLIHSVEWEVADDQRFRNIVQRGTAEALPELGHSVHVDLEGLLPARPYWYRFRINGHASPIGKVRTAPVAGSPAERIRIGVAGCQNYEHGFFTAYRYMADESFDAIFHYGDYIYEGRAGRRNDIPLVREHVGPEPVRIEDYRLRHALYKLDPDLQAAHASTAFLMTYDDHEIDNNWAADKNQDAIDPAIFLVRRFAAMQAWYENMPVRKAQLPLDGGMQMFRRLDYGQLLRVHLLDTRQYRDDQICEKPSQQHCRDAATLQSGQILGDRQQQWLSDGLEKDRTWNLIGQQVVVMPYNHETAGAGGDSWRGYPESRRRLVKAIQDKQLSNVVISTGDVHQNIVGYVPARDEEPDRNQVATEFVCTSISSLGDGHDLKMRGPDWRPIIARNPNVLMANGQRGYQAFTITPDEWRTDIMKVDKVTDHSGQLSRLASFTIEAGSPLAIQS